MRTTWDAISLRAEAKVLGDADCRRRPCIETCPQGAITAGADGKVIVDRDTCDNCGHCEIWRCRGGESMIKYLHEQRDKEEILKQRKMFKQQTLARRTAINLGKEADPTT